MRVCRRLLPSSVTILSIPESSTVVVDARLTRDQAALAITGLLPHAHADVIEHWLDQEFPPRRRQFRTLAVVALIMAMSVGSALYHAELHKPYHPARRRTAVVRVVTQAPEYVLVA